MTLLSNVKFLVEDFFKFCVLLRICIRTLTISASIIFFWSSRYDKKVVFFGHFVKIWSKLKFFSRFYPSMPENRFESGLIFFPVKRLLIPWLINVRKSIFFLLIHPVFSEWMWCHSKGVTTESSRTKRTRNFYHERTLG